MNSEPYLYESNLYNNGVLEILYDLSDKDPEVKTIATMFDPFFKLIKEIYASKIKGNELLTISFNIINAHNVRLIKGDGKRYSGENWLFSIDTEAKFEEITTTMRDEFKEKCLNHMDNFFNEEEEPIE